MKKLAVIFMLALCFMNMAQAQRYLPGQKGIQVTAGTVNGFTLDESNPNFAAHAGAAFSIGRRVEYSIAFGGKSIEENEEWIPDNFALLKMEKSIDEIKKISEEMKPISREMISVSWEIRENLSRDEIRLSRDRFRFPRDEIYLLWDKNEKRIFEKNLSRDENRLLGDFFYLIYVFGGNSCERK